jgi:hypothetical protein
MAAPNLFHYATSELSQDAFICWLLDWANPDNKEKDEALCALKKLYLISSRVMSFSTRTNG